VKLTPEVLKLTYEYLKNLAPFNRWQLPAKVTFGVTSQTDRAAEYLDSPPTIRISRVMVLDFDGLVMAMAHEMVHAVEDCAGCCSKKEHPASFHRRAKTVCREFGWRQEDF
jgi:hypothetical protein